MAEYQKPLPPITKLTRPYWDGAKRGELVLQHCHACGVPWFPVAEACPDCLGSDYEWKPVSGRGKVWSWIEMWQRYFRGFEDETPYNVVLVELDEGPRLYASLVDCDRDAIRCDMPVQAVFDPVTDEVALLRFRPA